MSLTVNVSVVAASGGGSHPAWVDTAIGNGWGIGQWARISGPTTSHGLSTTNTIRNVKSVNPSDSLFQGMIKNWCGGALAPALGDFGTYILGMGGGHGGYGGNDVFGLDLETRTWSELRARSSGSINATFGEYPDGSPSCYHTYFQPAATPPLTGFSKGILIIPKSVTGTSSSHPTPASSTPYPHFLDLNNIGAGWTRLDAIPDNSEHSSWREAMAGIWIPAYDRYFMWALLQQSESIFASLNPLASAGSQWNEQRPANANGGHGWTSDGIEQVLFYEPALDVIVTIDWRAPVGLKYLKPSAPSQFYQNNPTGWPVTTTGSGPTPVQGVGVDWSPARQAAIVWRAGTSTIDPTVYQFKYVSGTVGSNGVAGNVTYQWANLLSGSNTVTPGTADIPDGVRVYNRFRVASYSSGIEFGVVQQDVDGSAYAFRLS